MCHAPVALDMTAAAFDPDTEGMQISTYIKREEVYAQMSSLVLVLTIKREEV